MVMGKSWNMTNYQKSWNFVISHGILPILPPNCTKFVFFVTTLKFSSDLESLNFFPAMQKEERWSWKIKKWSWKSHGKLFCQVYGDPG